MQLRLPRKAAILAKRFSLCMVTNLSILVEIAFRKKQERKRALFRATEGGCNGISTNFLQVIVRNTDGVFCTLVGGDFTSPTALSVGLHDEG